MKVIVKVAKDEEMELASPAVIVSFLTSAYNVVNPSSRKLHNKLRGFLALSLGNPNTENGFEHFGTIQQSNLFTMSETVCFC